MCLNGLSVRMHFFSACFLIPTQKPLDGKTLELSILCDAVSKIRLLDMRCAFLCFSVYGFSSFPICFLFVSIVIIIISIQLTPPLLFIYFEWNTERKKKKQTTDNIYSSFLFNIFIGACFICDCQLVIKTRRDNKIPYSCVSWIAVGRVKSCFKPYACAPNTNATKKRNHLAMVWWMRADFNWFFSDHNAHIRPFY